MMPVAAAKPVFSTERLVIFLEDEMGLDLSNVKLDQVIEMAARNGNLFTSFEEYAATIGSMIAVHETYFLRHNNHHEWLENNWLPEEIKNGNRIIRILSAGCSTGEEPYSLFAHLHPLAERSGSRLEITALDINQRSLDIARSGKYGLWSLRGVCIDKERNWLDVTARSVYVRDHVKQGVHFSHHNLCKAVQSDALFDLVLCRNVLIYMHSAAVRSIYENLCTVLKPGGYLIPGPSDPNPPDDIPLFLEWQEGTRTYRKHKPGETRISPERSVPSHIPGSRTVSTTELEKPQPGKVALTEPADSLHNTNHTVIEGLIRNGQYDLAKTALETNLAKDRMDVRSYIMLAVLALDMDQIELAREVARKASFLEPDAPYTVYVMSDVHKRHGNEAAARNDLVWVLVALETLDDNLPVKYCEEITVKQLKEVVMSRLDSNLVGKSGTTGGRKT